MMEDERLTDKQIRDLFMKVEAILDRTITAIEKNDERLRDIERLPIIKIIKDGAPKDPEEE